MPPRSRWVLPVLIVLTLLGVGAILLDLGAMVISPMMFDSGESSWAWTMFTAIWTAPLVLIVGDILAWIGFARRRNGLVAAGIVLMAIPLAAAGALFGAMAL